MNRYAFLTFVVAVILCFLELHFVANPSVGYALVVVTALAAIIGYQVSASACHNECPTAWKNYLELWKESGLCRRYRFFSLMYFGIAVVIYCVIEFSPRNEVRLATAIIAALAIPIIVLVAGHCGVRQFFIPSPPNGGDRYQL